MPKLKKTIKAEQEQAYMSRVAQLIFAKLCCAGYNREKVSKLFGINPATCSARKNQKPQNLRLQLVEKVQHLLGFLLFLWYNKSGDENVGKES